MPRKVYTNSESTIFFADSSPVGSDISFTSVAGLIDGSGCMSNPIDFGSGARPTLFEWRAWAKTVSDNGTVDAGAVNIYLCTCTDNKAGQFWDANLGSGEKVLSDIKKLRNLHHVGSITSEGAISGTTMQSSGLVSIFAQRASLVFWNQTGADLVPTPNHEIGFTLTPIPDEIQS